jgi:hypothetical protein
MIMHSMTAIEDLEVAPPGYFSADYSAEEIEELNRFAGHGPEPLE